MRLTSEMIELEFQIVDLRREIADYQRKYRQWPRSGVLPNTLFVKHLVQFA
jgi:hypothetical protein